MSLTKFLTGKPGNVPELMETAKLFNLPIKITYTVLEDASSGISELAGRITYQVGGFKIIKVYTCITDRPIIKSLKRKAKKNLDLIKSCGIDYNEGYIKTPRY